MTELTQVAAWTVIGHAGDWWRFVLRSDNRLVCRRKRGYGYHATPFYLDARDCVSTDEAEELFDYEGWEFKRYTARDGFPGAWTVKR